MVKKAEGTGGTPKSYEVQGPNPINEPSKTGDLSGFKVSKNTLVKALINFKNFVVIGIANRWTALREHLWTKKPSDDQLPISPKKSGERDPGIEIYPDRFKHTDIRTEHRDMEPSGSDDRDIQIPENLKDESKIQGAIPKIEDTNEAKEQINEKSRAEQEAENLAQMKTENPELYAVLMKHKELEKILNNPLAAFKVNNDKTLEALVPNSEAQTGYDVTDMDQLLKDLNGIPDRATYTQAPSYLKLKEAMDARNTHKALEQDRTREQRIL